jgi:Cu(I)/Ag(I) efflux system membrane fusion protein
MKKKISNKHLLIGIALIVGVLIGYFISISAHQTIESSNNQNIKTSAHQHSESSTNHTWTCSMHPQIRQSEPGQCPLCGMDLITVSSGNSAADADPMVNEMTPEAVAMANIHTSRVTGVSPEGKVFLTGKVKADEQRLASVTAKFPGRIEKLYVNFTGQLIREGEKIATIYSPELLTAQKELLEGADSKETYPALYEAAREKLRLLKLTEKQIDEIENTGKLNDQFDVLADKGGVVTLLNISVGDYVTTGTVLYNVVDLNRVWVMLEAYESDLPFLNVGDGVTFTVSGVPGQTFTSRVNYIDPVINADTRTASVRAEIVNPEGNLKPEMFVNAQILTSLTQTQSSLAIPRTALLWSGKRSVVYIKVPNREFPAYEMREITIGPRIGEMYLVEAGLEIGEEIVTNGVFAIDAAAQLAGNYSMMMRPVSKTREVPQDFREQITALADAYFSVKNALVDDDTAAAKVALDKVVLSLGKVEMQQLKDQAHPENYLDGMALKEQLLVAVNMMRDAHGLETLREHFSMLSDNMLEITESFGLEKDRV